MGLQAGEQTSQSDSGSVVRVVDGQQKIKKFGISRFASVAIPAFAALSAFAACASSYFAYANQDSAYKAIILTSQIDAASSTIADGQKLTVTLNSLANFSDDLLPLQDSWLSIQSGRTQVSEAELKNIQNQMQLILNQVGQHLADFNEVAKRLHQNLVKMTLVFPKEISTEFSVALNLGDGLLESNEILLRNTRRMADSLVRQDAASMRDAQTQISESRGAIRKIKERITRMENSVTLALAKVASYLSAQRFARRPG